MSIKLRFVTVYLALWFMNPSYAGNESGGGGDAIVCFDGREIKMAHLFDLREAKGVFGDELLHEIPGADYNYYLRIALERLSTTAYGIATGFTQGRDIGQFVRHIQNTRKFISHDLELASIDDSYEVFIPKECKIVQAAAFIDENTILFDQGIWEKLSPLDQAGLILHEAIYWYNRKSSYRFDSRRARRIVAKILGSTWDLEGVKSGIPTVYAECESKDWGPKNKIGFTAFDVYDNGKERVVQFLFLDGDPVLSKKTLVVSRDFTFVTRSQDDMTSRTSYGMTVSNYEPFDIVQISSLPELAIDGSISGNKLRMLRGHRTAYPSKDFVEQDISCRQVNWPRI